MASGETKGSYDANTDGGGSIGRWGVWVDDVEVPAVKAMAGKDGWAIVDPADEHGRFIAHAPQKRVTGNVVIKSRY